MSSQVLRALFLQKSSFSLENTGYSIVITPSNDEDPWDYIIVTREEFDGYYEGDAEAVARYNYNMYGDSYTITGEYEVNIEDFREWKCFGEFVFVVYGCNRGVTTPPAYLFFGVYPEDIDMVDAPDKVVKVIRDGQFRIIKNGVEFNAQGMMVR